MSVNPLRKPRLVKIDDEPVTVITPRKFKSGRSGWFSQQTTVIDGKPAMIQVLIYHTEKPSPKP